jgi:predicted transcriptional regulator
LLFVTKRTEEEPSSAGLGELETDVMKIVWTGDWTSVRDVYEALRRERSIAYTTVMTVMGRLHDKDMLDRKQDGRTYLYRARQTRGQVARSFMQKMLERLFDGRKADAVAALLDAGDQLDEAELGAIRKALDEKEKKGKRHA